MKTTNYKRDDVVILNDGKRYKYLGTKLVAGIKTDAYRPLDRETDFALMKDAEGDFVPFENKLSVEAVDMKWHEKVLQWWKASNRWKHFLFAIPLGAVCGAPFTTGVGLGMEVKDRLYGGKADFMDFALTAVGGLIGHGAMRLIGLDYMIVYLINLIF